jgi:hypothetical protein
MDRLDELIKKTKNVNNTKQKKKISDTILSKIKEKFKTLRHYEYKSEANVKIGEMLRHVDINVTKLSIIGIVRKIEHFSELNEQSDVKTIYLYSPFTKTSWKINPNKYYLFKVHKPTKDDKFLDGLYDDYADQIEKYLKKNKLDKE